MRFLGSVSAVRVWTVTSLVVQEYTEGLLELRSFRRVINTMDKAGRQTDRRAMAHSGLQHQRQQNRVSGEPVAQSEHRKELVNREDTERHSACHLCAED